MLAWPNCWTINRVSGGLGCHEVHVTWPWCTAVAAGRTRQIVSGPEVIVIAKIEAKTRWLPFSRRHFQRHYYPRILQKYFWFLSHHHDMITLYALLALWLLFTTVVAGKTRQNVIIFCFARFRFGYLIIFLTHWGQEKMVDIFQMTFSKALISNYIPQ